MRYVIESMQQWERVFTDPDYWRPMVERILHKHNLGKLQRMHAGYPGSNAVFWVNDHYVIKIFEQTWQEGFERELEIYQYLSPADTLSGCTRFRFSQLVPRVLAHGEICAGQRWKYMVMKGFAGERLGEVWKGIPRNNQLEIAQQLGGIVNALHHVPIDCLQSMDTSRLGWRQFAQAQVKRCVIHHRKNNSLPEHLLVQIPDYLADAAPLFPEDFSPCIINSDLTRDHELLSRADDHWQITGLIDFGDVEIGYCDYEFVAIYLDAFDCDTEVMRAFLQVYDYPNGIDYHFNQRMMAYSILHRYLNFQDIASLTDRYGDLKTVETLEALQAVLWNL